MHWLPLLRVTVAEGSMEPAVRPGDWLLVWRTRRIRAGQIVLARHPGRPGMLIVKRAARRVDGGWWLESDNPDAGAVDSRRFGPVPAGLVEGRVLMRYWRRRTLIFGPNGQPCVRPDTQVAPPCGGATPVRAVRRAQWCSPVSGSSSTPLCRATSSSVSSRGRPVYIAQ